MGFILALARDPGLNAETRGYGGRLLERIHSISKHREDASTEAVDIINLIEKNPVTDERFNLFIELGMVLKRARHFDLSRDCFERVVTAAEANNDPGWLAQAYENLADLALWEEDLVKANDAATQSLEYALLSKDSVLVSDSYYVLGKFNERRRNYAQAIENFTQAIEYQRGNFSNSEMALIYLKLAQNYKYENNFEASLKCAETAISYCTAKDWSLQSKANEQIANVRTRLGQSDLAMEAVNAGLALIENQEADVNRVNLLGTQATIYRKIGYLDKALQSSMEALRAAEKIEDPDIIATTCLQLAVVLENLGNFDEALTYLIRVLDLEDEINKKKYIASALKTIGQIRLNRSELDEALESTQLSFEKYSSINDTCGVAASLFNIGSILERMGDFPKARNAYLQSLHHYSTSKDTFGISQTLLELGRFDYDQGRVEEGIKNLSEGLDIAESINAEKLLISGYRRIFEIFSNRGQTVEAMEIAEKYIRIHENLLNESVQARISNLQIVANIESKNREIAELRSQSIIQNLELASKAQHIELLDEKRIVQELQLSKSKSRQLIWLFSTLLVAALLTLTMIRYRYLQKIRQALLEKTLIIERVNDQLIEINKSKDRFFTMIAHDLKNSIGNLTSCINFVNTDNFAPKDPEALNLLSSLKRSSTESHQLLLNLLDWAKIQMARVRVDKQYVEIVEIVEETSALFTNSIQKKGVLLDVSIDPEMTVFTDPNILKTILRNLINNAVKFSYPGGRIRIKAELGNASIRLHVIDYGVGLPEGFETRIRDGEKFPHGSGTEGETGSGIGLSICIWLAKMIESQLSFQSLPTGGTDASIDLPMKEVVPCQITDYPREAEISA